MKAQKENNLLYNKTLKPLAHKNRYQMTKAEACVWKYALKAKQTGYTFNRQRPVLSYIADFMCKPLKLVIEVDGYSHLLDETIEKDKLKQADLEKAGFKVIRFKDEEILKGIENVKRAIQQAIEELKQRDNLPLPPPKGDKKQIKKNFPSGGGLRGRKKTNLSPSGGGLRGRKKLKSPDRWSGDFAVKIPFPYRAAPHPSLCVGWCSPRSPSR